MNKNLIEINWGNSLLSFTYRNTNANYNNLKKYKKNYFVIRIIIVGLLIFEN